MKKEKEEKPIHGVLTWCLMAIDRNRFGSRIQVRVTLQSVVKQGFVGCLLNVPATC